MAALFTPSKMEILGQCEINCRLLKISMKPIWELAYAVSGSKVDIGISSIIIDFAGSFLYKHANTVEFSAGAVILR